MFDIIIDSISYVKHNTVLLKEISFVIKAGSISIITANPKSGKTILCNILTGKTESSTGVIDIKGNLRFLNTFAEITFPTAQPVGLTVQEWITIWAENWRIPSQKLFSVIFDVYPIAASMLKQMCETLSSTEFYCLEIARHQLAPVACFIFDDAHLPLDDDSREVQFKVWEALKENGKAVLLLMPIDYVTRYPIIYSLNTNATPSESYATNGKMKLQLDGPTYRLKRFIQDGSINLRFLSTDVVEIEPGVDLEEVLTTINNLGIKWIKVD